MNASFAIIDNFVQLLIVIAVIGFVLIALVVPVAAIYFHHRKRQLWHETTRLALDKGQPAPPMPPEEEEERELKPPAGVSFADWQAAKRAEARSHEIKGGLVLVAVGAGLVCFLWSIHSKAIWLGAIPGFIGLALLAHAAFESLFVKPQPPSPPTRS